MPLGFFIVWEWEDYCVLVNLHVLVVYVFSFIG